ncbi:MAG: hypothetical protein JJ992_13700, partial [Planctomycetes bacterium]|nr:hypothetical protein [Planctomycetota bacterium]
MAKKSPLFSRLRDHFGTDPAQLPVLEQSYRFYDRPNLHLAVEDLSQSADEPPVLIGIVFTEDYHSVSLSKLTRPATAKEYDEGPVEYVDEPLPGKQRLSCVKRGLYLYRIDGKPLALLVSEQLYGRSPGIGAESMAPLKEHAEVF